MLACAKQIGPFHDILMRLNYLRYLCYLQFHENELFKLYKVPSSSILIEICAHSFLLTLSSCSIESLYEEESFISFGQKLKAQSIQSVEIMARRVYE